MAAVLIRAASGVKSQFEIKKEVDSSNTVFKLFSKVTVGFCVIASIIVATSEYLGSPINCQGTDGKIDDGVYNAYCWIHGGKRINTKIDTQIYKCAANQPNLVSFTKIYKIVVSRHTRQAVKTYVIRFPVKFSS